MSALTVIKFYCNEEIKRIPMSRKLGELTFDELCVIAQRIWKTKLSSDVNNLVLKYVDDDGDQVNLESDIDITHALTFSSCLKVHVYDKEKIPLKESINKLNIQDLSITDKMIDDIKKVVESSRDTLNEVISKIEKIKKEMKAKEIKPLSTQEVSEFLEEKNESNNENNQIQENTYSNSIANTDTISNSNIPLTNQATTNDSSSYNKQQSIQQQTQPQQPQQQQQQQPSQPSQLQQQSSQYQQQQTQQPSQSQTSQSSLNYNQLTSQTSQIPQQQQGYAGAQDYSTTSTSNNSQPLSNTMSNISPMNTKPYQKTTSYPGVNQQQTSSTASPGLYASPTAPPPFNQTSYSSNTATTSSIPTSTLYSGVTATPPPPQANSAISSQISNYSSTAYQRYQQPNYNSGTTGSSVPPPPSSQVTSSYQASPSTASQKSYYGNYQTTTTPSNANYPNTYNTYNSSQNQGNYARPPPPPSNTFPQTYY